MNRLILNFATILIFSTFLVSCLDSEDVQYSDIIEVEKVYFNNETLFPFAFEVSDSANSLNFYDVTNTVKISYGLLPDSFRLGFYMTTGATLNVKINNEYVPFSPESKWFKKDERILFFQALPSSGDARYLKTFRIILTVEENDPNAFLWNKITADLPFDTKGYVASQNVNGKLWVLKGDTSNGSITNQLFTSADGVTWDNPSISASSFPVGIHHSLVVYNSKLYCVGYLGREPNGVYAAKKEVWSSADGIVWNKEAGFDFENAIFKNVAVYQNKIFAIGGTAIEDSKTDLNKALYASGLILPSACRSIYTFDGTTWVKSSTSIPSQMPARFAHLGVSNANLYAVSGENGQGLTGDVWATENGNYWVKAKQNAVTPIKDSKMVTHDNNLYLFGGIKDAASSVVFQNLYSDGTDWIKNSATNLTPRYNAAVISVDNKIFVVGGIAKDVVNDTLTTIVNAKEVWVGQKYKFLN